MPEQLLQAYRHLELQNQRWLNQRVAWIVREFGRELITRVECVLPTSPRLAEYRGGTDEEVIEYFNKITNSIGLDPAQIVFSIEDRLETDEGEPALGLYGELEDGRFSIAIQTDQLGDPRRLLATLVHELCHVHLLGHRRLDGLELDHEPLTDLLCIFMGYGIIAANSVVHDSTEGLGAYRTWRVGRQGYMSMAMFGYALALFARLRNEDGQDWRRHMRADVRDAFAHSLRHFERYGMPDLSFVPNEFVEPILTIDTTPLPPPETAMAALYAYSVDPELSEEKTDYPIDQLTRHTGEDEDSETADQAADINQEDQHCVYCGSTSRISRMVLPALNEATVCGECRESIEEGAREAAEEYESSRAGQRLVFSMLVFSFGILILIILYRIIATIWDA